MRWHSWVLVVRRYQHEERDWHCAARVNIEKNASRFPGISLLLLTRSWLDRLRLRSRVAAAQQLAKG